MPIFFVSFPPFSLRYNVKNHRPIGVGSRQDQEPLTVEEVGKQLRVSAETVRMWIRTGELDAIDVGKYLIYPADLEAFKECVGQAESVTLKIKSLDF